MNFILSVGRRTLLALVSVLLCISSLLSAAGEPARSKPIVLVSIGPHKTFVESIAGDTVTVSTIVPKGANSHTYEPTPKQTNTFMNADIWFRIGEPFEPKLVNLLKAHRPGLRMVNMRDGVQMIQFDPAKPHSHRCCYNDFEDIHIWLSPKEAKVQAKTIAQALTAAYPQNRTLYQNNLEKFLKQLDDLDREIKEIMAKGDAKVILVSHPAYAYFARDYGLEQLSVEFEGKDPTVQQLTQLINQAKADHIGKVFIQPQHSKKGAVLIAKQLNATVVVLDPYAEDYFESMLLTAHEFSTSAATE